MELVGTDAPAQRKLARSLRTHVLPATRTSRFVYSAAAFYAILFAAAAALHYFAFEAAREDLGNTVQAIWSTAHGHFLQVTDPAGRELVRLGGHVDPFLALLVPLWWVWPSPLMLLVLQALAVAAGALPVFFLARKHLQSERAAAHFSLAYLFYPATQFNTFTVAAGFHAVSLAVPLLLFAIWFLDEERLLPFAAFALLAASTKEEIPLAIGCLGIWYAVRKRKRLAGLTIFALGACAGVVNFLVIIPHFAPGGVNPFADRYAAVGGTPTGILHRSLSDPLSLLHAVATGHKLAFVAMLLVPFLGLWLLEPLLFLGAVPDFAINLLSSKPEQTTLGYQYSAGIIPFVLAASIIGASRLKRDTARISLCALAVVLLTAIYSPLYFFKHDLQLVTSSGPLRAAEKHALHLIPADAPVSASQQLGGYLSARAVISAFPYVDQASWVIVNATDPLYQDRAAYRRAVSAIESNPHWKLVYSSHGVDVLRRLPPGGG